MPYIGEEFSQLCARCKVFEFDDAKLGGVKNMYASGRIALGFKYEEKNNKYDIGHNNVKLNYHFNDHLPRFPALEASSKEGCAGCGLLRTAILNAWKTRFDHWYSKIFGDTEIPVLITNMAFRWREQVQSFRKEGLANLVMYLDSPVLGNATHKPPVVIDINAEEGACASWLGIKRRPVAAGHFDTAIASPILDWVKNCTQKCCPISKGYRFIPTRLLYIGSDSLPRIVGRETIETSTKLDQQPFAYTALSYCWGGGVPLKTEKATLEERMKGIPDHIVPIVFREAIRVTRTLGIQYIWIDSLCIIQGDEEDWKRECNQMGNVFRGAYCTICAAQSPSCDVSFLSRLPANEIRVRFQSSIEPKIKGSYNLQARDPGHKMTDSCDTAFMFQSPWHDDQTRSRWYGRGWVFQEYILSPRKIIFGSSMLHYECKSDFKSQNGFPGGGSNKLEFCQWARSLGDGCEDIQENDSDYAEESDDDYVLENDMHGNIDDDEDIAVGSDSEYTKTSDAKEGVMEFDFDHNEESHTDNDIESEEDDLMGTDFDDIEESDSVEVASSDETDPEIMDDEDDDEDDDEEDDEYYLQEPLELSLWYSTVEDYSSTQLTRISDTLPALSGLAQMVASNTHDSYLAGIWKSSLVEGLLWAIDSPGHLGFLDFRNALEAHDKYIAPSWSWASSSRSGKLEFVPFPKVNCGVCDATGTGPRHFCAKECRVVEAKVSVDPLNPYGQVTGGYLLLKGKVGNITSKFQHHKVERFNSQLWKVDLNDQISAFCRLDWQERGEDDSDVAQSLQMVLLMSGCGRAEGECTTTFAGLLLLPTRNELECYRVGIFSIPEVKQDGLALFNRWKKRTIRVV